MSRAHFSTRTPERRRSVMHVGSPSASEPPKRDPRRPSAPSRMRPDELQRADLVIVGAGVIGCAIA
jgi:hypothetical protein